MPKHPMKTRSHNQDMDDDGSDSPISETIDSDSDDVDSQGNIQDLIDYEYDQFLYDYITVMFV